MGEPVIIALCGKGGVGKTSLAACLVRYLSEDSGKRVLAVDADPAFGLAGALGFKARATVDDIRTRFIADVKKGISGTPEEIRARLDYDLFSAIMEKNNIAFLPIGRPETEGCYCRVNEFLKEIITTSAGHFDFVVIDGEAGIEQINRRVMNRVTDLVLVSDPSARGINVAKTLKKVASSLLPPHRTHLVLNRVPRGIEAAEIKKGQDYTDPITIPEDPHLRICDIRGDCILEISPSPALHAAKDIITRIFD